MWRRRCGAEEAALVRLAQVSLQQAALVQELAVVNEGDASFEFTVALHSYFRVADIHQVGSPLHQRAHAAPVPVPAAHQRAVSTLSWGGIWRKASIPSWILSSRYQIDSVKFSDTPTQGEVGN